MDGREEVLVVAQCEGWMRRRSLSETLNATWRLRVLASVVPEAR